VVREALERAAVSLRRPGRHCRHLGARPGGIPAGGPHYAKSLAFARGLPLIAVNHIEGHIHAVILESRRAGTPVELPALALVATAGHTHLFAWMRTSGTPCSVRTETMPPAKLR